MEHIPVSGPWITKKEIDYVTDAVTNAWYSNAGVYYERFETKFAQYLGRKFAVSLPSCTSGLHLALAALGIGEGDEVIVPDITWIATSAPISYVGATPVFADVDEKTWCINPESIEELITPRTKAVIPVDLYGHVYDMEAVNNIARKHNISVIEDAAEAIGSEYKGIKAGNLGDVGVFSFHGSKTLTTGEGGMLVTDDENLFRKILFLRDHGRTPGDKMFCNTQVAYKYKMSSMQAALGLAQIERVEELISKKRDIFRWYRDNLSSIDGITLNYEADGTKNTYWMVSVILDEKFSLKKETIMKLMAEKSIDTRPFFHPLSSIPAYRESEEAKKASMRNKISYKISPYGINLPSGLNMDAGKVRFVCENLLKILDLHQDHIN